MFERYYDVNCGDGAEFKDGTFGHKCKRCGVTLWGNKAIVGHMREHAQEFYRAIKEILPPEGWSCKIFVGGCTCRGVGSSFRHSAHAHNYDKDKLFGWICIRAVKRLGEYETQINPDGTFTLKVTKPSHTLKHEYAHILAPNQGHTETWVRRLKELGGNTKEYRQRYSWGRNYTKTGDRRKSPVGRVVVRDGVRIS